jgi:hypothetical protein
MEILLKERGGRNGNANSAGAACDQKTSKFFISHQKEFMAGHMGVKGVY